jgi:hypothetical protein
MACEPTKVLKKVLKERLLGANNSILESFDLDRLLLYIMMAMMGFHNDGKSARNKTAFKYKGSFLRKGDE